MISNDTSLMAHLLRRAGFGANRDELERYLAMGYDGAVETLLNPTDPGNMPDDLIRRYHVEQSELRDLPGSAAYWMYRMISTNCPMEEKIALFWHGLFATGYTKLNQARALLDQVDMFRRSGLGSFEELLVELSKDPAMILWLYNNANHGGSMQETNGTANGNAANGRMVEHRDGGGDDTGGQRRREYHSPQEHAVPSPVFSLDRTGCFETPFEGLSYDSLNGIKPIRTTLKKTLLFSAPLRRRKGEEKQRHMPELALAWGPPTPGLWKNRDRRRDRFAGKP